ncbi:hypothetical protein QQF64_027128 [Cirrhinus molitorella]|uniref:Uncharacterized protein n=1 Tax=Cirrhinus molitorella TaxID=172907 RepID=A0ABR3NBR8_9TELE
MDVKYMNIRQMRAAETVAGQRSHETEKILRGQCFGVFAVPESQKSRAIQMEKRLIGSGLYFPMRLFCERCVFRSLRGSQ